MGAAAPARLHSSSRTLRRRHWSISCGSRRTSVDRNMKRGLPSSSASGRVSSSISSDARGSNGGSRLPSASASQSPDGRGSTNEGAVRGEASNYLVALAGMKALESHVQDPTRGKKWRDRVASWEERAGLGLPSVKLALGFLDLLGVSRASVYKTLLEKAVQTLLDKVPHLSEERMLLLLNDSFRYATQPELKSVPLKIITSMSAVPDKVLEKIIELQTHEPAQFEELGLPLPVKRLAWEKDPKLFIKVISPAAEKYVSSEFAPRMVAASQQVRFYRTLDTVKRRNLMGKDRIKALADYTERRPILIGYLCDEIANRFKAEQSQAKAGLWATLLTDVLVSAREQSYGSISDPVVDRLCALASRLDLAVREDAFGDAAVRDVQRLFREATGIGEDQQEKTKGAKRSAELEKSKHEELFKALKKAWAFVSKMDKKNLFKDPVTEAIAPGYHKIIKTPMDLTTVLNKMKRGGYHSFGDFDRDLRLMWENCRVFNGTGTVFCDEAVRQEAEWSKVASSFENDLRSVEARASQAAAQAHPSSGGIGTSSSNHVKRKSSASSSAQPQHDAPLSAMAPATQLDREGLGRRVGLAALLLSEPFAAKLMYRHACQSVPEACRKRETLPRDHPTFAPLLQLLELGDAARAMFRAGSFGVRAVEERLTRSVLPCVVALHARAHEAVARSKRRRDAGNGNDGVVDGDKRGLPSSEKDGVDEPEPLEPDWRAWYKEFPVVRRLTCTMLCRALVQGCDEAVALLMPAARAAVKKMPDELWLWASVGEVLLQAAMGGSKAKDGARSDVALSAQTLKETLELFSRGVESANVNDAVFSEALKYVCGLLPAATPSASPSAESGARKPPGVPRATLEEIVDKAIARAVRPPRTPRTSAEEQRMKDSFERVFVKVPEWRSKFSKPMPKTTGAEPERAPRTARSVSIKGPKRKAAQAFAGEDGSSGSDPKRTTFAI